MFNDYLIEEYEPFWMFSYSIMKFSLQLRAYVKIDCPTMLAVCLGDENSYIVIGCMVPVTFMLQDLIYFLKEWIYSRSNYELLRILDIFWSIWGRRSNIVCATWSTHWGYLHPFFWSPPHVKLWRHKFHGSLEFWKRSVVSRAAKGIHYSLRKSQLARCFQTHKYPFYNYTLSTVSSIG